MGQGGSTAAHEAFHNWGACHLLFGGVEPQCPTEIGNFINGFVNKNVKNVRGSGLVRGQTYLGTAAVCSGCIDLFTFSGKKKYRGNKVGNKRANVAKLIELARRTVERHR